MNDTDRIIQTLERLEAGQRTLQATVEQQGKAIERLEAGQLALQKTVAHQGKILEQHGVILAQHGEALTALQAGQKTLELKVAAFHKEQQAADKEILEKLYEIGEINAIHTDRRITRIEKHLGLPPLK